MTTSSIHIPKSGAVRTTYHPRGRGFDEYYGFTSGHWGDYFSPPLDHNGQIVTGNGFIVDDLAGRAMAFMADSAAKKKP